MKNFNDIYERIYSETENTLEPIRKKARNETICMVIIAIFLALLFIITKSIITIIIIFISGFVYHFFAKSGKKYKTMFKGKVINAFVKEYSQDLEYKPTMGISQFAYRQAQFEYYDRYYTEDLITGILDGKYPINMAEVKTQTETTDSDGDTSTTTVFHGLFVEVEINKIVNGNIKIRKNGITLFNSKDKIEMDSGEFEKKFNVYATDKIVAMQLLTADIMQMLLDFKEQNKVTPEMTIENSKLYIRFATGGVFEAKLMKSALDYDVLKRYYNIINFTLSITEKFLKNIEETEI